MSTANRQAEQRMASSTGVALGTIVSASATPYGYTVSLWSSGALLIDRHHFPGVGDVFLFAGGALAGFTLLGLIAHGRPWAAAAPATGPEGVIVGVLHWFAVGVAVGAVALLAMIPSWVAWPVGSFAATILYLLGASAQLALVANRKS